MLDITNKEDYLNGSVHKNLIIELEDGSTISNKNILKESMALDEILMEDNQLHFGRCNASEFSITLATVASNIKNEKIKVYIESNDSRLQLGEFTVNYVEKSADKSFKQITALDNMQNIDSDVTEWYRMLSFPITQKALRDSFFSYLGIEQVDVALPFDDLTVNDPFGNMVFINGRIIAEGICELNARFGHCNREGKFEYVQLNSSENEILDINKKYINCSYDDFITQVIDRVIIVDEYGTQVATSDSGNNAYVINNNFMLYGRTVDELRTLGNQFLELVKDVEYTPFTMENRGLPYVQLGDSIHATTNNGEFNSFIFRRTLRGIQALRDTYSAEGEEYLISDLNSIQQKIDEANRNTERTRVELTTSMEGLKSTITNIETIAESASEVAERANQIATNANTVANQANTKADDIAEDLDKNYSTTVEMQSQIKQSADAITSTVSKTYATQESVSQSVNNLQQQIDGAIETFTGSVVPTLSNSPASDWTTDAIKDTHIGDLYIVDSSGGNYAGFYYRFEKSGSTYQWVLLKDNEVTKALQDAKEANDKAQAVANNLANNYSTTTQMNSAIEQSANSIKSTVSATYTTKEEFNDLEIGGRNLILNSNFAQGKTYWTYSNSNYVTFDTSKSALKISVSGLTANTWTNAANRYLPDNPRSFLNGEKLTLSFEYYIEDLSTFDNAISTELKGVKSGATSASTIGHAQVLSTSLVSGKWVKVSRTFTVNGDYDSCYIMPYVTRNGTCWFRKFKLEYGDKATDWTPAPEDTDASIAYQQSGLGMKVNYAGFTSPNDGEVWLCAKDPDTNVLSNASGWVWWNGIKRGVPLTYMNPNTACPYNMTIYIVGRLSSASAANLATTDLYHVWYDGGWKYAAREAAAVGGTWTWNEATDIVLGSFVEPASEAALVDAQLFTPPKTSAMVTTATSAYKTAANAQSTANTANSKATTNANNITALTTRVTNAESSITQTASEIRSEVQQKMSSTANLITVNPSNLTTAFHTLTVATDNKGMPCVRGATTDNYLMFCYYTENFLQVGDAIQFKGVVPNWGSTDITGTLKVWFYDASKTNIGQVTGTAFTLKKTTWNECSGSVTISKFDGLNNARYFLIGIQKSANTVSIGLCNGAYAELTNTYAQSLIKQNADNISLKVSKGDVSSQLSVESDQVTISGNRLVVDADNFQLTAEGSVTCDDMTITGGQIDVIGETAQDTRITVTNSVENPVLSSAIGPGQMFFDFYDKYHTIIGAGMQAGSVGTCALLMDYGTMLVGLGHAGINFGYTNSSVVDAYYRRDGALINGNNYTKGSLYVGAKTAWNDTNTGWYLGSDGTMHGAHASGGSIHFHYGKSAAQTSSIDEPNSGELRLTPSVRIGNNASPIRLIRCGSSVLNTTIGATSVILMSLATVQSWYAPASALNTAILVTNGDSAASSVHINGTAFLNNNWYATTNSIGATATRINWMVICWS